MRSLPHLRIRSRRSGGGSSRRSYRSPSHRSRGSRSPSVRSDRTYEKSLRSGAARRSGKSLAPSIRSRRRSSLAPSDARQHSSRRSPSRGGSRNSSRRSSSRRSTAASKEQRRPDTPMATSRPDTPQSLKGDASSRSDSPPPDIENEKDYDEESRRESLAGSGRRNSLLTIRSKKSAASNISRNENDDDYAHSHKSVRYGSTFSSRSHKVNVRAPGEGSLNDDGVEHPRRTLASGIFRAPSPDSTPQKIESALRR